jgi:hypothetical protein
MKKELIVAKYDKDVTWITQLNDDVEISVYRKDNILEDILKKDNVKTYFLDNIGREMHTYFHHIYKNYNNLSDYIFFVQDYPFDHWEDVIDVVNSDTTDVFKNRSALNFGDFYGYHFNTIKVHSEKGGIMHTMEKSTQHGDGYIISCYSNGFPHDNHLNVDEVWDILFDEPRPTIYEFIPGAHFCVSKQQIQLRPMEFYDKILKVLDKNNLAPWLLERLVCYIFNPAYKIKM